MCAEAPRHLGKGAQMPPPFHPRLVRKAPWRPIPAPRCFRKQHFVAAPRPKSLRALWKPDQGRLRSPPCRTGMPVALRRTGGPHRPVFSAPASTRGRLRLSLWKPIDHGVRALDGDQRLRRWTTSTGRPCSRCVRRVKEGSNHGRQR